MILSPRSHACGRRSVLGLALAGLLVLFALPASASAQGSAESSLSCRASAARVNALGNPPLVNSEPVRANAPETPCTSQSADTVSPTSIGGLLTAEAARAATIANPREGTAGARVAATTLNVGAIKIGLQGVQASADVRCDDNNNPVLTGASRVVGLTINGTVINIPAGDKPVNLLGGVLRLNEQTVVNGRLVQRAVHLSVPGVADVVLAEAIADGSVAACTPTSTTPPPGPNPCPNGAEYDPSRNLCIIRLPGSDRVIVIGKPFTGPSGGTVIPLDQARRRFRSPCLSGPGPAFAIIGTNGADRITGRNDADRILLLAGNDQGDGGRGNDCIDGGSGVDRLSGAIGNDRLFGGSGRDRTFGGSGKDFASGGSGNDFLRGDNDNDRMNGNNGNDFLLGGGDNDNLHGNAGRDRVFGEQGNDVLFGDSGKDNVRAGYGHDRLYGGTGNDFLGAFLLGPTIRMADGGRGFDTLYANAREVSRARHVERIRIFGNRRLR